MHKPKPIIRKYLLATLALAASFALLSACGAPVSRNAMTQDGSFRSGESAGAAAPAVPAPMSPSAGKPVDSASSASPVDAVRLIVRNAELTLVVKDTLVQLEAISRISSAYNGYITSSSTQGSGENVSGNVVLRVEGSKLDAALADIRKLAVEVRAESVRGDDVTAEYVDLDSRVRNLQAAEEQLQVILKQATKTEDVMAVFNQLTQVRGQIEEAKGRMKFLSGSAALATITLTLIPDASAKPIELPGWRPTGVAKQAFEALLGALQGVANVAIWLIVFVLPLLLAILIPIGILIMIMRRVRRARLPKSAPVAKP